MNYSNVQPAGAKTIDPVVSHNQDIEWHNAMPGERVSIRVAGTQVNGRYSIMESFAGPGSAAPLHTHLEDEIFYVLDGVATFALGAEIVEVQKGAVVVIPAGTPHSWKNRTAAEVHMLAVFVAGGVETLFTKIAGLSPEQVGAVAATYGTVIVGPPIQG